MITTAAVHLHLRWLIRRDVQEVLDLDTHLSEDELLHHLRDRCTIGFVAEHQERVVGYMLYQLRKTSIRLLRLKVRADWQRNGVGSGLLKRLTAKLDGHRRNRVQIVVPEHELEFQLFLRTNGFQATKVLRRRFENRDGYWFVYRHQEKET